MVARRKITQGNNWVMFGDGNMCAYLDKHQKVDPEIGEGQITFLLKPSSDMIALYELENKLNVDGYMIAEFHKTDHIELLSQPMKRRDFVFTTIEGDPTQMSRINADLKNMVRQQQRIIKSLEIGNASLSEKYKKMTSNQKQLMKEERLLFEEAIKIGRRKRGVDDEEEDMED